MNSAESLTRSISHKLGIRRSGSKNANEHLEITRVRVLAEATIQFHGLTTKDLNWSAVVDICDACTGAFGSRCSSAVGVVIKDKLNVGMPEDVRLALMLVEVCVKNCGIHFARHLDDSFMRAMQRLLKLTSFRHREATIENEVRQRIKGIWGTAGGVPTDPKLHRIKRKVLWLLQLWTDSFMMHEDKLAPLFGAYRSLRAKGVVFPTVGAEQRFFVKNAETSPAFEASLSPSRLAIHGPITPQQVSQLSSAVRRLREHRCTTTASFDSHMQTCRHLHPLLRESIDQLASVEGGDSSVRELARLLDLNDQVEKILAESDSTGAIPSPQVTSALRSANSKNESNVIEGAKDPGSVDDALWLDVGAPPKQSGGKDKPKISVGGVSVPPLAPPPPAPTSLVSESLLDIGTSSAMYGHILVAQAGETALPLDLLDIGPLGGLGTSPPEQSTENINGELDLFALVQDPFVEGKAASTRAYKFGSENSISRNGFENRVIEDVFSGSDDPFAFQGAAQSGEYSHTCVNKNIEWEVNTFSQTAPPESLPAKGSCQRPTEANIKELSVSPDCPDIKGSTFGGVGEVVANADTAIRDSTDRFDAFAELQDETKMGDTRHLHSATVLTLHSSQQARDNLDSEIQTGDTKRSTKPCGSLFNAEKAATEIDANPYIDTTARTPVAKTDFGGMSPLLERGGSTIPPVNKQNKLGIQGMQEWENFTFGSDLFAPDMFDPNVMHMPDLSGLALISPSASSPRGQESECGDFPDNCDSDSRNLDMKPDAPNLDDPVCQNSNLSYPPDTGLDARENDPWNVVDWPVIDAPNRHALPEKSRLDQKPDSLPYQPNSGVAHRSPPPPNETSETGGGDLNSLLDSTLFGEFQSS